MIWVKIASFFMLTGVMLGAFGAHGLKARLTPEMLDIYKTGVLYQLIHGLGIFIVAWLSTQFPASKVGVSGACFAVGIIIFSGSLYALSITGARWLGAITPIGGLLLIVGWILIFVAKLSIK